MPIAPKTRKDTRQEAAPQVWPRPAHDGFRMPAEWEPQAAVWFSWPHRLKTWPGHFRPIPGVFAKVIAAASRFQPVRVNCPRALQPRARRLCKRAGADMGRVEFFNHPTDDAWCRDHGPIFVKCDSTGEVALTDWEFNAWGRKYPAWERDNAIPRRISAALGVRRYQVPMILEGGSIEVNGQGLLLTTESCLLNRNRNPNLQVAEIEESLKSALGVKRVEWLGEGIAGDDTDGHVDDLTRFFKPDGIVTAVETNSRDANYRALAANAERLQSLRTPQGRPFDLRFLPMPRAMHGRGQRLPASYANFLILNGAVLVPVFGQPRRDGEALEILRGCFPGREIVGIDCRDLVLGLGTLHCISQQQPA